jgi:hypothetical protein
MKIEWSKFANVTPIKQMKKILYDLKGISLKDISLDGVFKF